MKNYQFVSLFVLCAAAIFPLTACTDEDPPGNSGDGEGGATGEGDGDVACEDYSPEDCPHSGDCMVARATPLDIDKTSEPWCIQGYGERIARCRTSGSPTCEGGDAGAIWVDPDGNLWATSQYCPIDEGHELYDPDKAPRPCENGNGGAGGSGDE